MARRKITNSQAVCITLLWGVLCYMLLVYSETINFDVIFARYEKVDLFIHYIPANDARFSRKSESAG